MLTRFFEPDEIQAYFEKGTLEEDLLAEQAMAIGSIADLLYVCESYKKRKPNVSHQTLQQKLEAFQKEIKKCAYLVDLNESNLAIALFEREGGRVIDLWPKATDQKITPRRSIRYLTLRDPDGSMGVEQSLEDYDARQSN